MIENIAENADMTKAKDYSLKAVKVKAEVKDLACKARPRTWSTGLEDPRG